MTGREFFKRFYLLITFLSSLFRIFPWFICSFLWALTSSFPGKFAVLIRYCLLANRTKHFGQNIYFGTNVVVKNFSNISIGSNVTIHDFCYIDAVGGLFVGNNVSIAHASSIITFNHTWSEQDLPIKYNPVEISKVVIEDDVWIGCGVRIMPGVKIGSRSIVAAGAVVTKDVPSGTLVVGVPAKVVREIV